MLYVVGGETGEVTPVSETAVVEAVLEESAFEEALLE